MKNFFEKLASINTEQRSSEHLKLLGKRAAGMFSAGEVGSLGEAVQHVVGDESLNRDQVARITETANQETWKTLFVEGGNRQVHFEPADPTAVLGELSAKPEIINDDKISDIDFTNDVPRQRPSDSDLAEAFGVKRDTPEYEALSTSTEEAATAEKTASALDIARYGIDNAAGLLADAGETLYRLVKQAHIHDGHGILQITQAVASVLDDPNFSRDVMQKMAERLESEGVKFDQKVELQKVAHPLVVNHRHPLLQAAVNFEKSAFAYYSANETHTKLAAAHRTASGALRNKLRKVQ